MAYGAISFKKPCFNYSSRSRDEELLSRDELFIPPLPRFEFPIPELPRDVPPVPELLRLEVPPRELPRDELDVFEEEEEEAGVLLFPPRELPPERPEDFAIILIFKV